MPKRKYTPYPSKAAVERMTRHQEGWIKSHQSRRRLAEGIVMQLEYDLETWGHIIEAEKIMGLR